jgi:hypothetical protein
MDGGNWASLLAAVFAAVAAWAVQRSSSRANVLAKKIEADAALAAKKVETEGEKESTRSQAETDAYERARAFDVATIERQSAEILQVRADNIHLNADVKRVHRENQDLFAEREALRNEIRVMHEERAREREECHQLRSQLARAISEGRPDLSREVENEEQRYSQPIEPLPRAPDNPIMREGTDYD